MVDAPGVGVDDKAVDVADSLAVRADDVEPVEADNRVIDVSGIEITQS